MPLDEKSKMGHGEESLDPQRQIDIFRRYLRGEKNLPYNNPATIIRAARIAIKRAVDILCITGRVKGQRKYTDKDLEEMNAEVNRLEGLLKRKNDKGEDIEREIDGPLSEKESDGQKQKPETAENTEMPLTDQIKALINEAVVCYDPQNTHKAKREFEKAIEKLEEARSQGIDVADLELEIKSLSSFFLK
jgi:cysteinyl-tRNA synthetase